MRKTILLSAVFMLLVFCSCNKNNSNQNVNPYAGTKWGKSCESSLSGNYYMYILELNESDFCYYRADINGNYEYGMTRGAYTYSGSTIRINNVEDKTTILDKYITGATISGNMLTLKKYWVSSNNGQSYDEEQTLMKMN